MGEPPGRNKTPLGCSPLVRYPSMANHRLRMAGATPDLKVKLSTPTFKSRATTTIVCSQPLLINVHINIRTDFGFCNRGDACHYSHDTNAMPANLVQIQMAQMRAMMNAFGMQPNGWGNPTMMMNNYQGFPGPNTMNHLPNGRPQSPVVHPLDEMANRSGELPVIQVLNPEPQREQRLHSRHEKGPSPP